MIEIEEFERNPNVQVFDLTKIGLSLYIHIPWCVKKCPYCDFNSHALPDNTPFFDYTNALIKDAQAQEILAKDRPIISVFIGGGTPSLLPVAEYHRLFEQLRQIFDFAPDCEITLEANPATLEHASFEDYRKLGINRLSLGVQTFDNESLQALGRIHNKQQAIQAIINAKNAGFERLNVDIMHGLPNQTPKLALADLEHAVELGATHISWYQLTIEPNTTFFKNPPELPSENMLEEIECVGREFLINHNFNNYEVSAWVGANDSPCRHNMNYWKFGDYLAIGAGAHGKITLLTSQWQSYDISSVLMIDKKIPIHQLQGVYRFSKTRSPKDYLNFDKFPKFATIQKIADNELPSEFMMNALRLKDGVTINEFESSTGLWVSTIDNELIPLKHQGLMVDKPELIAPTELGFRYVNHLVQAFL